MNRDILGGKWKQLRGELQRRWGRLSDDEIDEANGNFDILAGKIQEHYGYAREYAERDLDAFLNEHRGEPESS